MQRALNLCQDYHTSLISQSSSYRSADNRFNLWIPVVYTDGEYFLARSFRAGKDSVTAGSKIIRAEGKPIDRYVAGLMSERVLRYDFNHQRFYSEQFYLNMQSVFQRHFTLAFKTPEGGRKSVQLPIDTRLDFINPIRDTIKNQVSYWEKEEVLYIKLYRMDNAVLPRLKQKLADFKRSGKTPERIIVDLRDNSGGNDVVWQTIYESILPSPVSYPLVLDGLPPRFLNEEYFRQQEIARNALIDENQALLRPFKFKQYYHSDWKIIPNDSSRKFTGKVIILGSELNYSSGASAFQLARANKNDSIYLISRPTGMFLGTGFAPIVLTLANSRLSYRIEPVGKLSDLMHDEYEITLPWSLQEIRDKAFYPGDTLSKDFMLAKDPIIKRAMSL
ncbi:S41 family peptidase [Pedobacter sp. MC2016-05]|uniref:S41 family peptidase n=1 Tax=Pedobacter sp. MC2016-05 TaxID=2994474 RepID=UPI00224861C2|nr:S41 family peptidase [Pedobacter sp. MC2016-05]MCX2476070.1 S41 family peptidase [Pedobacter sp. MC2016-05]